MVRSDSADEEQIMNEDGYELIEEDEDMSTGTGALPVIIPEWNTAVNGTQLAAAAAAAVAAATATSTPTTPTGGGGVAFDLSVNGKGGGLRMPTSTIGHAPLLTNRSISQPAPLSPASMDPDRRLRRQIANCNERRRMQSINAGFMALRALLPRKEGEKLSKAAILQQTADMVHQLLLNQNGTAATSEGCEAKKPKLEDTSYQRIQELQASLESERSQRQLLEKQVAQLREILQHSQHPTTTTTTSPIQMSSVYGSPERKPSINNDPTSSPLSMLTLNGSPSSSGSPLLAAATPSTTTATIKMNPIGVLESTVIRPTPLAPISVEVSSPSLSTPSPLTINQPSLAPILFHQQHPQAGQSNLLFVNAVTSSMSTTGASTPIGGLPQIQVPNCQGQPSAFVSTQSNIAAHHSLQTIIDAIRHLEGGTFRPPSPPPTSKTSLVR